MKITFNDATSISVQSVTPKGDYLEIKTIEGSPEKLCEIFSNVDKTRKMIVEERGKQTVYEGYTSWQNSAMHTGGIYSVMVYKPEKTPEVQEKVQAAAVLVAQMQAQNLTDEQALEVQAIYPAWNGKGISYAAGFKVLFAGVLYKCLQDHVSQLDWMPDVAPSLWAKVLVAEDGSVSEWQQPDSTNAYMTGDKVLHNGITYESLVDNNVWEPGATGSEALWKVAETE